MEGRSEERPSIPGVGAAAAPGPRLRHEETPFGRAAPLPERAARALAADLARAVAGEVRFDAGTRAAYSTDASNYRQVPIGVVCPRSPEDVEAVVEVCRRHGVPVLGRGGGTSLAGQCCNVAVVIDFSKYLHRVLALDPEARRARVEPGCALDALRSAAERHRLTFGPDPATHVSCTLGGMIGNNSCGMHAQMAGRTSDNVERLEVLTSDGLRTWVGATPEAELDLVCRDGGRRGEIHRRLRALRDRYADEIRRRFPRIPRRISGYNLDELLPERGFHLARALVGSESTCVLVLQAELRLVPSPPARVLLVLGYPDVYEAGDHVPALVATGPMALEGIDHVLVEDLRAKGVRGAGDLAMLPEGRGFLVAEYGGEEVGEARDRALRAIEALRRAPRPPAMRLFERDEETRRLWRIREAALAATARVPGHRDTWEGWEDSAVPVERLGEYLRALRDLYRRYGYEGALYGHFGQACVHTRIDWDPTTSDGIARWNAFVRDAADLVVRLGGSLSGEHGDGQARGELLPRMFGERLVGAFQEFKSIWDPDWRLNPGKVVRPYHVDENLRLGERFVPARPRTRFAFRDDGGSFGRAALRCVGVGACRREGGGVMCPSYMVTREELHSTRGRARALFEMTMGEPIRGGWRSPAVADALHLCLSCKGCKSDCPMNVDMATYKAEFLSHHYAGRLRPRAAYTMGLIAWWARLAALAPAAANAATHAPVLAAVAKRVAGIAPERTLPRFAPYTFRRWFRTRRPPPARPGARPVLLYPDTFTDFFHPEVAIAAVEVLEANGWAVELPPARVCCGRPLYDWGMLDLARRQLRRNLAALRPALARGTPIVVLEPSCAAVFRDELPDLLGDRAEARRLADRVQVLSELVDEAGEAFRVGRLARRALVQPHCHQHAVIGTEAEGRVLSRIGLAQEVLDAGCCGMAGAFGFEAGERYRVSVAAGERALLPAVRALPADALVLANGFSCRTQIAQGAGRRALHLAEAMRLALAPADGGARAADGGPPVPGRGAAEVLAGTLPPLPPLPRAARVRRAAALAALGALAVGLALRARRR